MTTLAMVLLAALLVVGGLIQFSVVAARRIEKAVPPQGGFLDLDGERLHVLDKGVGPPVVMIHGLSGQMGNFTHSLVDRLCKDFRVVTFDRPGSGYSTRSTKSPAGVRAQAETLAKAIGALKLALDHPDCVGALALISPATHPVLPTVFRVLAIRSPLLRRLFAWTLATPGGLLARTWATKKVFAPEAPPVDFAMRGGGLLALRSGNIYATSLDMMTVLAHSDDAENMIQRYATLRPPVGILFGRGDQVLDWRAQGETMKRTIPSLDLEIVDGGHMLPVTQPEVSAAFIRRMAARIPARTSNV